MKTSFKIGKVKVEPPFVLAPMAGVTDHGFRLLSKKHGAGLVFTEMVNSIQIIRLHEAHELFKGKTSIPLNEEIDRLLITDEERPVTVQLFGADAKTMAEAGQVLEKTADIIDVNLGCPSPKITKGDMGSKLLLYPDKIKKIISEMSSTIKKPVTVKMRTGYTSSKNAVKIAKICEKAGAEAVAIHGRTTKQGYSGKADWEIIHKIKNELSIPVIGNGDVTTPQQAVEKLSEVDGVMIGRAARGNPFIFSRAVHLLKTGELLPEPTKKDKINAFKEYVKLSNKGFTRGKTEHEKRINKNFKMQAMFFIRGFDKAAEIRRKISQIKTNEELLNYLNSL